MADKDKNKNKNKRNDPTIETDPKVLARLAMLCALDQQPKPITRSYEVD